MAVTRRLEISDAPRQAELLRDNRKRLERWHPRRNEQFFSNEGQVAAVQGALDQADAGNTVPLVIVDDHDRAVGTISIQSIIRGFFQSCSVGFWLASDAQGRGLATSALREVTELAFHTLRLHRVEAGTLLDNERSQRVLERGGFTRYGTGPNYLKIDDAWRDHALYQLLTPTPDLVRVPD